MEDLRMRMTLWRGQEKPGMRQVIDVPFCLDGKDPPGRRRNVFLKSLASRSSSSSIK
jgi:hypothetical protein